MSNSHILVAIACTKESEVMLISKFKNENSVHEMELIEKKYAFRFPSQYKAFVDKYNGGYTPKTKFKVGRISSDIVGFYGFGNSKMKISEEAIKEAIRNGMFPIAEDSFGNKIMIGILKDIAGKIFFYDHEKENKLSLLTDSLEAFIAVCKSEKISEASRRTIEERETLLIAKGKGNNITDGIRKMWQAEIDKYKDMIQEEVIL